MTDNYQPIHFYDQPIEPIFDTPPAREKTPDCPDGFVWEERTYRVTELLASWNDFTRRGTLRVARNMRPAHAMAAASRGSLNVGRFYFRVRAVLSTALSGSSIASPLGAAGRTDSNESKIFDIYYDRAMKNVDDRKGQWFIYREMREE